MDDSHLVGELGQEDALFHGAVAAANDDDVLAAEEEAVACAAIADAAAGEFHLAGDFQMLRRCPGGHNDGVGRISLAMSSDGERRAAAEVDLDHFVIHQARAKMLGLILHDFHHLRAGGSHFGVVEARIVFHFAGQGNLAAQLGAGDDDGVQQRPRGVDGGR